MENSMKDSRQSNKVILLGIDGADPCMIRKLSAQGLLPNITEIIENGFFSEAVPSITAKTPQNWTTIATGAEPGTHEITDLFVQPPDKPLSYIEDLKSAWLDHSEVDDGVMTLKPNDIWLNQGFQSGLSKAEFLWNTCENNGKKVIVFNYACATPNTLKEGMWIGGAGTPNSFNPFTIDKPRTFVLDNSGRLPDTTIQNVPGSTKLTRIWEINLCREREHGTHKLQIVEIQNHNGSGIAILRNYNWKNRIAVLKEKEHSDFIEDVFIDPASGTAIKAAYKFVLIELGRSIKLYRTKIFPVEGLSVPAGIYEDLVEHLGPFMEFAKAHAEDVGFNTVIDLQRELNLWISQAVVYLYNKYLPDLLMVKTHLIDNFIHTIMPGYSRYLDGEKEYKEAYDAVLEAYRIMDEIVAVVRKGIPEDINLLVVSDHGGIPGRYKVPVNTILADTGLVQTTTDKNGSRSIDFDNSKCLAIPLGGYIYINLIGRQLKGIVPSEDYEELQEQIIDTLLNFVCPVTKKHPFTLVCRKQEAGILGINNSSANSGDVIYLLRPPFRIDPIELFSERLPDFKDSEWRDEYANEHFAHHGDWMPGVRYKGMSDLAVFMGCGPALKKGYSHKKVFRLTGVAPTISRILGIPEPKDCEGGALLGALQSLGG